MNKLFIGMMNEIANEFLTDSDIEYDMVPNCAYLNFIEMLKEELAFWDIKFDNLTHTLVNKVDGWVNRQMSAQEIIDTLKRESEEEL